MERDAYASSLTSINFSFREKVKEFSIIKRIGDSMRWNLNRRRICVEIVDIIIDETASENCSLWIVNPEREVIEIVSARGQRDADASYRNFGEDGGSEVGIDEGPVGWVVKTGKPLLLEDIEKSEQFKESASSIGSNVRSLLCIPLKGEHEVIGVVNMSHPDPGAFSKEDELALGLITNQAALAFANLMLLERMQEFNERLEREVEERTRDLRYSEGKYRSFTEQANDAIMVVERKSSRIVEVNGRACDYTGYSKVELLGKDIRFLMDEKLKVKFESVLLEGSGHIESYPIKTRDKGPTFADISVNTIATESGELAHLIIHDITNRLRMEEELKEYSEHLEEKVEKRTAELEQAQGELMHASKMAALGELSSGVAHEVNNPIAVIRGYAEDLLDSGEKASIDAGELDGALNIIMEQADKVEKITRVLLNLSRKQEMSISSANVCDLINQSIRFASHKGKDKKVTFEKRFGSDVPQIVTDASMLEQVLLNLYNNALDAIEEVGTISTVTNMENDSIKITIKDNGPGISTENLKKIFNPFFTTKPIGRGTGLGLSTCRRLISRLNGTLGVVSVLGEGTEFTIELPLRIENQEIQLEE